MTYQLDIYPVGPNGRPKFSEVIGQHVFANEDLAYAFERSFNKEHFYNDPEPARAFAFVAGVVDNRYRPVL